MFKTVNLEMSLKPFKKTDDEYIRNVCRNLFEQWRPLLKNRETVTVMLWTADGSEILDYAGNQNDKFEWRCYIGTANRELIGKDDDPDCSLHSKKHYYMDNPPVMTYGILKKIIATLKEEGKKAFPNSIIRVGETFDIGPEFAKSDFKYNRHPEISSGTKLDAFGFVDATALLNEDDRRYAAYPDGIPQDTPFGTFFGKQANIFLKDMGFDYLWLSNGLGFSSEPWDLTGKVFDGKSFYPEKLEKTRKNVFDFWRLFRKECPDFPLETRGTNNSVGIDYATDGVPLYDIYNAGFNITPPPNSPWAALNDNFGLELMGHMTRICELPGDEFMFRYYIHDPWWLNSPWYDRYNGSAHDIYLPMAVSRIDNTYDINRGVTNHAQTKSIIEEYMERRKTTKLFAEWFSIDPPYEKFLSHEKGHYVNRVAEAIWFGFKPIAENKRISKFGQLIDPKKVVEKGQCRLHATDFGVVYDGLTIETVDTALVAPGEHSLLNFTDIKPLDSEPIFFNLYNNIWGTNFPMWYEDNARFRFNITIK